MVLEEVYNLQREVLEHSCPAAPTLAGLVSFLLNLPREVLESWTTVFLILGTYPEVYNSMQLWMVSLNKLTKLGKSVPVHLPGIGVLEQYSLVS
jgi:hypothetical protein